MFFLYLDACFILHVYVTMFAASASAIHGYPTIKCFVICIKDRLPNRHSCLNLHPCVIKFSQSVSLPLSVSLSVSVCLSVCLYHPLCLSLSVSVSVCLSLSHLVYK